MGLVLGFNCTGRYTPSPYGPPYLLYTLVHWGPSGVTPRDPQVTPSVNSTRGVPGRGRERTDR